MEYQQRFKEWLKDGAQTALDWPYIDKQLCSVTLEFVSTKARTSKLTTPPYDIDNASKLILDCITTSGLVWYDDKTIARLDARKRFAKEGETAGTFFTVDLMEV
jgi:Holliday junction resolvase RusA-like endonuclease